MKTVFRAALTTAVRELVISSAGGTAGSRLCRRRSFNDRRGRDGGWAVDEGEVVQPTATATMPGEVAWRLLFNALPRSRAQAPVHVEGDAALAMPLLRARSIVV